MLELWPLLPISILIATTAMATGIGGALFFSPLFLLGYGVAPAVAFTLGIAIEVFGFASGLFAYARERLIDYRLGLRLLAAVLPAVILGVALSLIIPERAIEALFALFLIVLGIRMAQRERALVKHPRFHPECHAWREGKACYKPERHGTLALFGGGGGALVGLFSSGIGELNEYLFLRRMEMPPALASGTSVFIVAVAALTSVALRTSILGETGGLDTALPYLVWAVPGVLIGGQLGMRVARYVKSPATMRRLLGFLFLVVGLLLLVQPLIVA